MHQGKAEEMTLEADRISPEERQELHYEAFTSPIGVLYPIVHKDDLVGVVFSKPHIRMGSMPEIFRVEIEEYFKGKLENFSHPMKFITGTDFQQRVWLALRSIPFGETRSYKWLAKEVGSPRGNRAVGGALSRNPLPIVLPCHRIIQSTGKLGGYTPGEDIKRRLLAMEYYAERD